MRRSPLEGRHEATLVVSGPHGAELASVELAGDKMTVGRLPDANDIALQPDPELLVTRAGHCTLEREGRRWFVIDGGSVNGTFLRRAGVLRPLSERTALHDGDVICVLATTNADDRRYFELAFEIAGDSQATRAIDDVRAASECLNYDTAEARLVLVRGSERHAVPIRAQAHRLVRYMVERNLAAASSPVLCTHDELMQAVWEDEPMHTREELAKLVWEVRKKLEPLDAEHLIENERGLGYRIRTCPGPRE